MKDWLSNILRNGTIQDNSTYVATDGIIKNIYKDNSDIELNNQKRASKFFKKNDSVFKFLKEVDSWRLDVKKEIVLFNDEDYEHNTDDALIKVSGMNFKDFKLHTGNLIGYVRKGDYALKITSRFGDEFLRYIISDADGFLELENEGGSNIADGYDWLLYYLWATKLKKAYRLGIPKNYISQKEKLPKVRGNLDVVDYFLNKNTGKFKCNYREHSYNTPTARLIKEVFDKIDNHAFLSGMRPIKNAFTIAIEGKRSSVSELIKTDAILNSYYQDYNPVIDLSKKILQNEGVNFGNQSNSSAFLFDISMLFEYFIRKLLSRNGFQLKSKFDERLKIPTGSNSYERKLEPDMIIKNENTVSVFDVKYKNFNKRHGVNREDLFQLHTYVGQYGNKNIIDSCGFIYPVKGGNNIIEKQKMSLAGKEVDFYVICLAVPENDHDRETFTLNFRSNIDEFISSFGKMIHKSYEKAI